MKVFLMKINVNACTLENSSHIFSSVSGKLPPGKFPIIKLSVGESPWKIPTWNIPTHVFKYARPIFLSFFHYCYRYHWYYLKDCFEILCFKCAERQLMKQLGIFQVRIFWMAIFWGQVFQGGVWWVGIFRVGVPPGGFS